MNKARILIVDDEVVITAEISAIIEKMGYNVVGTASDGEEALDKARTLLPDIILMDIVMPGEMDGISASVAIKKQLDIPVIFMTAFGGEKVVERAKETAPYGFILKPFQTDELKASIEVALARREMEIHLLESEQRYRAVVDTALDAIITINQEKDIIGWNKASAKCFGYESVEVIGKPFDVLFPESVKGKLIPNVDDRLSGGEVQVVDRSLETTGLRKDGSEFPLEFSMAAWNVNKHIHLTVIARDITERKKIDQMKSDFVSLVSHQLKTPVAGIMGCVDNMMYGITGRLTFKQMEYLQVMKEISVRGYRIISNLLNVSRIERGVVHIERGPVSLKEIADKAILEHKNSIENKGLEIHLEPAEEEVMVFSDRDKLFEAVSNLVHNAYKYTEKGQITLRLLKTSDFGIIEVADTGVGISEENQKALFKKDQVLKGAPTVKGGCGLGLYIAKEFLQLQNSDVTVSSTLGTGTTFRVSVPLYSGLASEEEQDG